MNRSGVIGAVLAIGLGAGACGGAGERADGLGTSSDAVRGAAYTTFVDASKCFDSPNGIDCNHYDRKQDVYVNGGPIAAAFDDGAYFFAVLEPGAQSKFLSGEGLLSTDGVAARSFQVSGGVIVYSGGHPTGTTLNGKLAIALVPYADTSNPGGVYLLAVCHAGATGPSDCKFDAFHVESGEAPPPPPDGGHCGCPSSDPPSEWTNAAGW